MSVTLKDIARRAGVSISTVSRVINNDTVKPASPETTAKVWSIVHELNYVPNQSARMLIHRASDKHEVTARKSIGCILSASDEIFTDPFFSEVIAGVQEEATEKGYSMEYTFAVSGVTGIQDANFFNNISTRKVRGIVLLGRLTQAMLDMLRANIPCIVYCGLNYIEADIPQVICDAVRGITMLMEHLISKGHKRIGFIGETNRDGLLLNERRYDTYCEMMAQHGLPIDASHVIEAHLSLAGGYRAMLDRLQKGDHASAYICANDITAIGVMRAVREAGLRVPEDISIVAFDDIEMCSYVNPPLTTIQTPRKAMGQMSVRTLIDQLGPDAIPVRTFLPMALIERGSSR